MKYADRFRDWLLRPITDRLDRVIEFGAKPTVIRHDVADGAAAARATLLALRTS